MLDNVHTLGGFELDALLGFDGPPPGCITARATHRDVDLDRGDVPRGRGRGIWFVRLLGEDGGGAEDDRDGGEMHGWWLALSWCREAVVDGGGRSVRLEII
jgi:hypothetical protein